MAVVIMNGLAVHGNRIRILQNALVGCLSGSRHSSLVELSDNIMQCNLIQYCRQTQLNYFKKTDCGLIHSDNKVSHMKWLIIQSPNILIKWNFIEFMVFKNDVMCSMSNVEFISENRAIYCGYYLPFDSHSKGSVTIIQHFITTLKTASYFKVFFYVEYNTLVTNGSVGRYDINMIIHARPSLSHKHVAAGGEEMLYILGSFPYQALNIMLALMKTEFLQDLTVYDGPSELTPVLWKYTRHNAKVTCSSSSFQALLVLSMNFINEQKAILVTWSTHIMHNDAERCRSVGFGKRKECYSSIRRNGITLMKIFTNDLLDFIHHFTGPDTYSNEIDSHCQYGGFWIYSSADKAFTNPVLHIEHCSHKILINTFFSNLKFIAIVVVQYIGVSSSKLEYTENLLTNPGLSRPNVVISSINQRQILMLSHEFHVLQIGTRINQFSNAVIKLSETLSLFGLRVALMLYTVERNCFCEASVWYIPRSHDDKSICNSVHENDRVEQRTLSSKSQRTLNAFVMDPRNITLNCERCTASGFILFWAIGVYDSYSTPQDVTLMHVQTNFFKNYSLSVRQKFVIWLKNSSADHYDVKIKSGLYPHIYHWITFSECIAGKEVTIHRVLHRRGTFRHLSQRCSNACLITGLRRGKFSHHIVNFDYLVMEIHPVRIINSTKMFHFIGLNNNNQR